MKYFLVSILVLLLTTTVSAQSPPPPPEKLDDLVRLLQDPEIRTWVEAQTSQKEQLAPPQASDLSGWEAQTRARIHGVLSATPRIPGELAAAASRTRRDAVDHGYAPVFIVFAGLIAAGLIGEQLFLKWRRKNMNTGSERLLSVAVFTAVMAVIFFLVDWPPLARMVLLVGLAALVAYRTTSIIVDMIVTGTSHTRRIKLFLAVLAVAVSLAILGPPLLVDSAVTAAISYCFSVVLLAIAIEALWSLKGKALRTKLALALFMVLLWGVWCLGLSGLFWLGVYALVLPGILRAVDRLPASMFGPDLVGTRRVLIVRGSRAIVVLVALAWLAAVWHFSPNSLTRLDPSVSAIANGFLKSVVVVLIADLVWHLAKSWIDRRLEAPLQNPHTDAAEAARQGRLRTLLPIFRNVLAVLVAVMAGLIILAEFGVQIGPLIAGAGIFGVAIGFGSQTLVKDVISGVFYMLDDAFRVGEYIQAKNYKGTVEGFSLRSVRLRHHRGPVYTVPFGELGAVENMSRDWAVVKFIISVGYDTDVAQVKALTKTVGRELRKDPEFEPVIIENLKMKGVEKFGDYGIDLSFGMMLKPSALQSMIRRRAYAMIREAFIANGIKFATPSIQVGNDEKAEAAVAAATAIRADQARAKAGTI